MSKSSYTELQNTARNILNLTPNASNVDGTALLQQIENFCGKLDKFVEEEKTIKSDLQKQVNKFRYFYGLVVDTVLDLHKVHVLLRNSTVI